MSVQSQIDRITNNVQSTLDTIAETGVDVGSGSDALPAAAAALANEKQDKITVSGILKSNGSTVSAAQAGTDYEAPGTASGAVYAHNTASDAHSGLFAGKMPRKIPIIYITESTSLSTDHAEAFTLANSTAAITLTIPSGSTIPVGTMINITNINTGTVSFATAGGVTLHTKDGKTSIDGQYAAVTLLKASDTIWYAWGALA